MKKGFSQFTVLWLIILYGIFFFLSFLGQVHLFDWDEINFAESAREMLVTGDYLTVRINFQPFWEKPPLFIWMQVLSMKLFGINEFAARFPNVICGIVSLWVLYKTGKKLYDARFGLYWMLAYTGSFLPFFYFKSGIIDPWFNLFIFLGIIHFVYYQKTENRIAYHLYLSALFLGMAVLTKGPAAILIFLISFGVYLVFRRFKIKASLRDVLIYFFIVLLVGGSWYILQIILGNFQLIKEFVLYQIRLITTEDAGHGGFFLYHFFVLLVGVFPASFMALLSFKDHFDGPGLRKDFFLFVMILFWVVLVLFSVVNTKIVHYSSLCYFPLTFFAALTFRKYENSEIRIPILLKCFTGMAGLFFGLLVAILPLINRYIDQITAMIGRSDPFSAANLQADVTWPWFISVVGIAFIVAMIISLCMLNRNRNLGMRILYISSAVFTYFTVVLVTPRIEGYTQRAAIEFFKSVSSEKAYITTLGYKSYAHLYYGKVDPADGLIAADSHFLLEGDIDRDAYFVFKINHKERYLKEYPFLEVLYEKNGFVFAKRVQTHAHVSPVVHQPLTSPYMQNPNASLENIRLINKQISFKQ